MPKAISSTLRRRNTLAKRERLSRRINMRSCANCVSYGVKCLITPESSRCIECDRSNRKCDLAPPGKEIDRAIDVVEELDNEILKTEAKAIRLRKQRKFWLQKLKSMGDVEAQNILELEVDEREEQRTEVRKSPAASSSDFAMPPISPGAFNDFLREFSPLGGTVEVPSGDFQGSGGTPG